MLVRDIMTSPAVTIRPDDDAAEAARVLDRLSLTSLPVVDRDLRLLGIIGEADLIAWLATAPDTTVERTRVEDLMTRHVLTASADDELSRVVGLMAGTVLKSVPVLLRGRVVGVVSRRDVVRSLAQGELDASSSDVLSHT